jgi:hypothetical protein
VKFEIEKNPRAGGLKLRDNRGSLSCEKLEADFEKAALASEGFDKAESGRCVGRIHGNDDFFFGGCGHSRIVERA